MVSQTSNTVPLFLQKTGIPLTSQGMSKLRSEERLRADSGFSYLIREVQQLFEQLSVASFVGEVLVSFIMHQAWLWCSPSNSQATSSASA